MIFDRTERSSGWVRSKPDALFTFLDDPRNIGAHMRKPSVMMLGGSMDYAFDDLGGKAVGSIIHIEARMLGLRLAADEQVTERAPPRVKKWSTVGNPKLLVIGGYEMGFEIEPVNGGSMLAADIRYALPQGSPARVFGRPVARFYARWCVSRIVGDATRHFSGAPG